MILEKKNTILGSVKKYFDQNLNPKRCNIIDPRRENHVNIRSIDGILEKLTYFSNIIMKRELSNPFYIKS